MKSFLLLTLTALIMLSSWGCAPQPTQLNFVQTMELRKMIVDRSIREHTPTTEQINKADFGPQPVNYQEIIKTYYKNKLFDPYSAVYEFNEPQKSWHIMVEESSVKEQIKLANELYIRKSKDPSFNYNNPIPPARAIVIFGWKCIGTLNAKNRYGAYVGTKPFEFIIKDGVPINTLDTN